MSSDAEPTARGAKRAVAPRVVELVDRLERDIRARRLEPGDAYLSAADAARMLRVSVAAANRALQILTHRGRVERRQRVGSVIAAAPDPQRSSALARVSVIAPRAERVADRRLVEGITAGLTSALGSCQIVQGEVPSAGAERPVDDMLREAAKKRDPVGFVLIGQPIAVQRAFAESGLPSVVYGGSTGSIPGLTSLDRDHEAAGRLLLHHLLGRRRRLLVLMNNRFAPGDQSFLDSLLVAATEHGLTPTDVTLRFLPRAERVVDSVVRSAFGSRSRAMAIVCRDAWAGLAACKTLAAAGRKAPVGVDADLRGTAGAKRMASIRVRGTPREHGRQLADLLIARVEAPNAPRRHVLLPVELVLPE